MNLRDLKYLVALADTRHFGKAAERCFVSQPTLSAQIKKLEDYLGVPLVERQPRNVALTAAGEEVVERARRVIRDTDDIVDLAHLSRDPGLLKAFAAGEDVHRATAAEIFNRSIAEVSADERRAAKTINFGLIYGMSAFGLAIQLNLDRTTAQAYIDNYFARYPGVKRYMDETRAKARELGYVETVLGRRLWLQEIRSSNPARRQGAERAAINAPMQGTAADLIKLAMIAVQHWLDRDKLGSRLIMQVHDELVLEVPDEELARVKAQLPQLMAGVARLEVPLLVDVGSGLNWEAAH